MIFLVKRGCVSVLTQPLFSGMLYISLSVYATGGVFRKKNTAVPISIIPNTP